jgi:site-specific DNA-methyltransferase (adenine-specific)
VIPFEPLWTQYKRLIKPRGAVVLFGSQPFTSAIVMSNPDWFKYELIWEKGRATGFVHAKNKPLKAHENILVFSPGTTVHEGQSQNRMTYNPQFTEGKPYTKRAVSVNTGMMNHAPSKANLEWVGTVSRNDGFRYPVSVLWFSLHNVGLAHPTQKPVELCEYLIRTYTNEGETVLDNTMGSGTTMVACINASRNGIGIELDPTYYEIAQRRIAEAQAQPTLPLDTAAWDSLSDEAMLEFEQGVETCNEYNAI